MIPSLYPPTKCGLPYSGCYQCNPEQWERRGDRWVQKRIPSSTPPQTLAPVQLPLPGIREEFSLMYPTHESDFAKKCPSEWAVDKVPKVADAMIERYQLRLALKKARKFLLSHQERSWGWKYWDAVVGYLEDQTD